MKRKIWVCFFLLLGNPFLSWGSEVSDFQGNRNLFSHLWGDLQSGFYDPTSKDWNGSGGAILGTTMVSSLLFFHFGDDTFSNESGDPKLGDASRWISGIGEWASYGLPVAFFLVSRGFSTNSHSRESFQNTSEMLLESLGLTMATVFPLKFVVGRNRPFGEEDLSLPSAHSATAFSSAGILAFQYPWFIGVPCLLAAGAVAFSRLDLGKHYVSDVLVGAGIGLFYANGVHRYHTTIWEKTQAEKNSFTVVPSFGPNHMGFSWIQWF